MNDTQLHCHYSDLPSPLAYMQSTPAPTLNANQTDRIIEMAWEDRTPFDAIFAQFGLKEDDIKLLMRRELSPSSYRRWRARVAGRNTKHRVKNTFTAKRFKCSRQRSISRNSISKRKIK